MALRATAFTASGVLASPDQDASVSGLTIKGFTSATVYNGADATGDPVLHLAGPGTVCSNLPIRCDKGIYVQVAGTGSGTVHL